MKIRNAARWPKAGSQPYFIGMLGFGAAFALRYLLQPLLDDHVPLLFFAINCIVIAYFYGFWPALWLLLLSTPTAFYFFVQPYQTFDGVSRTDFFMLLVNFTLVLLAAFMLELLRREQYKSFLLARVSESRFRLMVEADEDRRQVIKKTAKRLD